jgi:nitroimidazol reductase NimA-like FMN-containing flavoprotein (pyridoxamine 5'-phosphate oxidase superfamily)
MNNEHDGEFAVIDLKSGLEVLDRATCLRLLATNHMGRIGVIVDSRPAIFPINYVLDGERVVFRTAPGTKLHAAIGHAVAFEIDGSESFSHGGWSVLGCGTCTMVIDPTERDRLEHLPLKPYGPGLKNVLVLLALEELSGRRIVRP